MKADLSEAGAGFDRRGERAGIVGIAVNLMLAGCKLVLGMLSGSVSVMADAANNLSDCGGSVLTILGFRLSARPADKEHPFGHARYEYITGLMLSFLILLLGFSFLKESVLRIFGTDETCFTAITLILLGLSVAAKLGLGWFYRHMAGILRSQTLRASSVDSFTDAILTSVVLLGGLLRAVTGIEADGYVGLVVAVVILIAGGKLVREATGLLLGKAPDKEMVDSLDALILSHPEVLGMHDLMVHSYGESRIFATAHVEIDARTDLMTAHTVADCIEQEVLAKLGIHLVVHVDPMVNDDERLTRLRANVAEILRGISPKLGYHDLHLHKDEESVKLFFDLTVPVDFILPDEELLSLLCREIEDKYPDILPCIRVDRDFGE
ncbi:MAG: cation diffusion facilitator family transporter [Eubacteriales bacterium]